MVIVETISGLGGGYLPPYPQISKCKLINYLGSSLHLIEFFANMDRIMNNLAERVNMCTSATQT